jgi:hypothetical protein
MLAPAPGGTCTHHELGLLRPYKALRSYDECTPASKTTTWGGLHELMADVLCT